MNRLVLEQTTWPPIRSDINRAVQAQKLASGWKFWIEKEAESHRTYGSSNSNWYVKFQMFMSARAFSRVSYFAVFFTEYLNVSLYVLIEAYIFSISI